MVRSTPVSQNAPTVLSRTVSLKPDKTLPLPRPAQSGWESVNPLEDPLLRHVPVRGCFKVLGDCVIYSTLGRGSMGAVFRARDLGLGIDVAVKCLIPGAGLSEQSAEARFEREAQLGSALDHPNVVQVLRHGQQCNLKYLVMEYVHGETLRQRVARRGGSPLGEAIGIVQRAARGLAAAHRSALIHRDIKPANLMLGVAGEVKVCDLGLAKALGSSLDLTLRRSVLGSPRYMAPEQWHDSRSVGPTADVYSLGATLYFLLAGRDANQGEELLQIQRQTREQPFPDLRDVLPSVPPSVAGVIRRCVARNPSDRFQDCGALASSLDRLANRHETTLIEAGRETSNALHRKNDPIPAQLRALGATVVLANQRGVGGRTLEGS